MTQNPRKERMPQVFRPEAPAQALYFPPCLPRHGDRRRGCRGGGHRLKFRSHTRGPTCPIGRVIAGYAYCNLDPI